MPDSLRSGRRRERLDRDRDLGPEAGAAREVQAIAAPYSAITRRRSASIARVISPSNAAIALGTAAVAQRRRRQWRQYDTEEIRSRLHERFAGLDAAGMGPGRP